MIELDTDKLLNWMVATPASSQIMLVSPVVLALIETTQKFGGRDWRRLKREQNKVMRKARQR